MAVAAVGVGIAALGMITSFMGSRAAEDAARDAARKEAVAEGKVTAERLRQLDTQERILKGQTIAAAAGSGVTVDKGSPLMIMAEQAKEFAFEKGVTADVGATKAAAALQRGRNVGEAYRYQSYANLAQGASNIFSIIANKPT